MPKKKKPIRITLDVALHRMRAFQDQVELDVASALQIEAVLNVGNEFVGQMSDRAFEGAPAYNAIKRSLAADMAMHLARLFDGSKRRKGFSPNRSDKASIPNIIHLLRQQRCQRALINDANWHSDGWLSSHFAEGCEKGIRAALSEYSAIYSGPLGRKELSTLKLVRDKHLAHSLLSEKEFDITYGHLFRLLGSAAEIVQASGLAIKGSSDQLDERKALAKHHAELFWRRAFAGKIES